MTSCYSSLTSSLTSSLQPPSFASYNQHRTGYMSTAVQLAAVQAAASGTSGTSGTSCLQRTPSFGIHELLGLHGAMTSHGLHGSMTSSQSQHVNHYRQLFNSDCSYNTSAQQATSGPSNIYQNFSPSACHSHVTCVGEQDALNTGSMYHVRTPPSWRTGATSGGGLMQCNLHDDSIGRLQTTTDLQGSIERQHRTGYLSHLGKLTPSVVLFLVCYRSRETMHGLL